jgi:hypothetical protein
MAHDRAVGVTATSKDKITTVKSSIHVAVLCTIAVVLLACSTTQGQQRKRDEDALAIVARTTAQNVDPTLPAEPLDAWLQRTTGVSAVSWQINRTCGADVPTGLAETNTCPETTLRLVDGEEATVLLLIQHAGKGLAGPPRLRIVYVEAEDGSRYRDSDRLSELPGLISK